MAAFNLVVAWVPLSTSTSRAAVLTFTMPMMSVLLAWAVLGERVSATLAALSTLMVPVVGVLGAMALVGDWRGFALVLAGAALIVLNLGGARRA